MFYKILLSLTAVLVFTACSSSEDPHDIAVELCEYNKDADFQSIKQYASDELKVQLDDLILMLQTAEKTKEGRELLEQQREHLSKINCKETTTLTKQEDGSFRVINDETELNFTLTLKDGSWQMGK